MSAATVRAAARSGRRGSAASRRRASASTGGAARPCDPSAGTAAPAAPAGAPGAAGPAAPAGAAVRTDAADAGRGPAEPPAGPVPAPPAAGPGSAQAGPGGGPGEAAPAGPAPVPDTAADGADEERDGDLWPVPGWRGALRRLASPAVRTHLGSAVGVLILVVLLWRLGTGPLLDGLRRIDGAALAGALGIGVVTTFLSAWRWQLVARGLRVRLPLGAAVADYYRALFLNAALPGGVLGDVHRAVRHGRSTQELGRCVRAVVLERVAGQLALAGVGAVVLLTLPSPVRSEVRHAAPLALLAAIGALAVVLALRMSRVTGSRAGTLLREIHAGLLSRHSGPGVALSSVLVLAGHLAMFVLAARVAGTPAGVAELLPIGVLALLAMSLPLNVGGWGPREGVTAWAFGAAGLGAATGLAAAVVYGALCLVASLPGLLVLLTRRPRTPRADGTAQPASGEPESARPEPGVPGAPCPASVSSAKYGANDSARLASSALPLSAEPSEGRPMTPESV